MSKDPKTVLILLVSVYGVASLECNTCKDVVDVALCNTTQLCHDGQACFHNLTRTRKGMLINLGCMDYQQCGAHGTIPNTIIGREIHERQTSNCLECCSTDQCNRVLCEHLKPSTCVDDESIDCAKMNTLFSICTDIDNAKNVCPKFCGLCNVVDGNWSEWSSWSQCDVTCDNGSQSRTRSCTNPAPEHGGLNCVGNGVEVKTCHRELCPGFDFLLEIVSQGRSEIRIDVTAADGSSAYETFGNFSISGGPYYTLHISRGTGTLGDLSVGLSGNNNMHFSTYDHDMDRYNGNCAEKYHGAWWFTSCLGVDLNGIYFTPGTVNTSSMSYLGFKADYESLKSSKMMFRRV